MVTEADQAKVIDAYRGDDGGGDAQAGEGAGAKLLRERESGEGRRDADETAAPGPPVNLAQPLQGRNGRTEDGLHQQEARESRRINHEGCPDGLAALAVEFSVGSRLEGIGRAGSESDQPQ